MDKSFYMLDCAIEIADGVRKGKAKREEFNKKNIRTTMMTSLSSMT